MLAETKKRLKLAKHLPCAHLKNVRHEQKNIGLFPRTNLLKFT
jgi:hypothetical protein